ncbi:MAG: adenylosuccinate lyase [Candidatus Sumerlaeia bacterium]|nr:adenylosuccinate lyase [Candidatus Sumerlaeia bacterium]
MIERYSRPEMAKIWSDETKYQTWLEVEVLACEAWAELGKIPRKALDEIRQKARLDIPRILEIEAKIHHDVVAFTTQLAEVIGPASKYVHMGLTSNDVVDTAQNVRMVKAADLLIKDVDRVLAILRRMALEYKNTVMIGRTHGVHAEPITFGLKCLVWYEEFRRHRERLRRAREIIRVGKLSGAVGTFSQSKPFIEEYVCKKMGLKPAPVATQVVQRDRHAEYMTTLAIVGAGIERIATEIRHLQRTEVREASEPFGKTQKGSSAMPHKRNPEICERLTGQARILRANALAAIENVTLWHERDISHSSVERVIIPDSTILLDYMFDKLAWVLDGLKVNPERMRENLESTRGLMFSQPVMIALVQKGLTREEAYAIVQRCAMQTWDGKKTFKQNLLADREGRKHLTAKELDEIMQVEKYLTEIETFYERCGVK